MSRAAPPSSATAPRHDHAQVKETLVSIIIAFVLAFVFRAFVIEAFVIPTGSMAPTLMGAHERITSPNSGYTWPVGPWNYDSAGNPLSHQGSLRLTDPMTGEEIHTSEARHSGDRILVFKYLYSVYDPTRFDVVVFKAPHEKDAATNYIKRLVGLPGEELALIDGDVFVRTPEPGEPAPAGRSWGLPGWQVQRKDERTQRSVWQPVFSSEYEPLVPPRGYASPWEGDGGAWQIQGRQSYAFDGPGPATLSWSSAIPHWEIDDFYPYNELPPGRRQQITFNVNDLRLRCGVEARAGALNASAVLRARGHEFRADISGRDVVLRMGALGPPARSGGSEAPAAWTTLATGTLRRPIEPGRVVQLEFWHADQALWLFAEGDLIARGQYDWSPRERIRLALNHDLDQLVETDGRTGTNTLALRSNYPAPEAIRWEFTGGPLTLHRVGLDRDIHYESNNPNPGAEHANERLRAAHPLRAMVLGPHQFFVCGDNSPQSKDARLWEAPDPWVAATIDTTEGVVPRHLMIGRAFFVYFPSLIRGRWSPLPMPDFGRMRFIW
ncbi:MAG: signal peptidase I [Phycisphaerales bacterium]